MFNFIEVSESHYMFAEFSGQNFDEGHDAGRICSLPTAKRMKTVEAAAQNHG